MRVFACDYCAIVAAAAAARASSEIEIDGHDNNNIAIVSLRFMVVLQSPSPFV